ncbi:MULTISPECIES: hypothetical protein [Streptomycetaceae]
MTDNDVKQRDEYDYVLAPSLRQRRGGTDQGETGDHLRAGGSPRP